MKQQVEQNFLLNTPWHSLEIKDVFKKLDTRSEGLKQEEILFRQKEFGLNKLPSKKAPTYFIIFLKQFLSPLIYILIFAGLVSLILGETVDSIFIFAVIVLNSLLGTWQENKAEKNAAALQNLLKVKAHVKRDGFDKEVLAEDLVIGDLVFLESGVKAPADIRLFEVNNIKVDQAFLTGESELISKNIERIKESASVANRSNMVYAGSTISSGRAWGVIVETGLKTEVGKIAEIIGSSSKNKAPLIVRMEVFNKKISVIILFFCLILAVISIAQGIDPKNAFFLVVALAVSAIPEGLPVALTVALSVATTRMLKKNVIVRKLTAVEGLGSCTMIASDKTGTLTVNQQTAKLIYLSSGQELSVSGQGYNGEGEILGLDKLSKKDQGLLDKTIETVVLSNEASLYLENNKWEHYGDSMDIAFLSLAYKLQKSIDNIKQDKEILLDIPYESERRYSAKIFLNKKGEVKIAIKGSVDRVLDFCSLGTDVKKIKAKGIELASHGYRVLAVAEGDFLETKNLNINKFSDTKIKNLNFLSLVCFIDPLRAESKEAVKKCREAGVEVAMITGDHPATALFIAKELGIAQSEKDLITGEKLGSADLGLSPEFIKLIKGIKVFARVSPLQKLKIVNTLVKMGHFVAVTGDGVNDAPALKQANIGVAMGSGTDITKETATMIVVDDNFSSIVSGVEEGRFAYDNVRKVVYFVISSGMAEIVLFILAILTKMPLPLFAAQLLWLNVVTNGIQDISLAFEPGEDGVMKKKPRSPQEGIFNKKMINQTLVSGVFIGLMVFAFWIVSLKYLNIGENYARNLVLMLMILFQNMHLFNCRSERSSAFKISLKRNLILVFGVLAAQGLHIIATFTPFMQKVLQVSPISFKEWLYLLALSSLILIVMEIFKIFRRRLEKQD